MRDLLQTPEGLSNLLFTAEGRITRTTRWFCMLVNISLFAMSLFVAILLNADMLL